jgi:hypothetical protein
MLRYKYRGGGWQLNIRFTATVFSSPHQTLDRSRGETVSNRKPTADIELASRTVAALAQIFIDERDGIVSI